VLLCRHHHTLVHDAGWTISGDPGDLHFHRPDGTELGIKPPPRRLPAPLMTIEPHSPIPPGGLLEAVGRIPRLRGP
jgi:hypothetical protein